jgi:hypothetical protein
MKTLFSAIFLFVSLNSFALWQPLGSGLSDRVRAVVEHDSVLYAGGNFPGLISKWDGVNWTTVGALTGTSVRCLISFNGDLYAGGMFTMNGNSGNIARWDGINWVAVGDGLGGVNGSGVMCMYVFNGVLYAGGTFNQSGSSFVSRVAKLVNGNWVQVGGGSPSKCQAGVYAMINYNNQLYVGGEGTAPWLNVLDISGTVWNDLAPNGIVAGVGVYALGVLHYPIQSLLTLFIGGKFSTPFLNCCTYFSGNWGTSLNQFSGGASDRINAFLSTDFLYAGGVFTVSGTHVATNLAKKGTTLPWDTVGVSTINNGIDAFTIYQGYMVCGGNFTDANGITMNHIMINDGVFVSANNVEEKNSANIFPNPAHTTIHYSPEGNPGVRQLILFDVMGKKVFETEIEKECDVELRNMKSGIYLYSISEKGNKITEGKLVIE